ncbi:PROTEIN ASPARTIC PROTEASE IN GUARD CELL 1 [Salix koriyanagi]|uniref:PROTEIN ASPARTIC PROTEASE IN GUARD CELL 1 n=1 Tax=Salix koriyanagi TaxID=2511006 RepID=A0A9Q0UZ71_9ROSI|nr:PROTEIN ASPARTIC PROTEASE IN GUARD CELL 1 [Salix koriyanagi]
MAEPASKPSLLFFILIFLFFSSTSPRDLPDSTTTTTTIPELQLALEDISKSDLQPLETDIQPEDLSAPVTSGVSQGSGEYFTRVGVGNPARQFYMVLDTGSDINWLQCHPCTDCYQQTDPVFDPSASSTYAPVTCQSQQCSSLETSSCRGGRCLYQVNYGDGSYTVVNRNSAGSSTLDFNSVQLGGDSVTAPLMKNRKIDTFLLCGSEWNESITRLQTQAYNPLRDAFAKMTQNLERTSAAALFDTCYDLSGQTSVRVPTVSFHFTGGKSWNLPAANYLVPVDSAGTFCFAFAPTTSSLSIIGNVQQQGTRVTFDLANSRMGFSPNKC